MSFGTANSFKVKKSDDDIGLQNKTHQDVSPDESSTEENSPKETVSEEDSSEETTSEESSSKETASEETASEEDSSEETASEEDSSEETASEEDSSEETAPEETAPEETAPEETAPEEEPFEKNRRNGLKTRIEKSRVANSNNLRIFIVLFAFSMFGLAALLTPALKKSNDVQASAKSKRNFTTQTTAQGKDVWWSGPNPPKGRLHKATLARKRRRRRSGPPPPNRRVYRGRRG